jgi:hypothetical protein
VDAPQFQARIGRNKAKPISSLYQNKTTGATVLKTGQISLLNGGAEICALGRKTKGLNARKLAPSSKFFGQDSPIRERSANDTQLEIELTHVSRAAKKGKLCRVCLNFWKSSKNFCSCK